MGNKTTKEEEEKKENLESDSKKEESSNKEKIEEKRIIEDSFFENKNKFSKISIRSFASYYFNKKDGSLYVRTQ